MSPIGYPRACATRRTSPGPHDDLLRRAEAAVAAGAGALMLNAFAQGLAALQAVREAELGVPIFAHRVGAAFLRRGGPISVSARVLAELTLLLGADYVQVGSFGERTFDSDEEILEQIAACRGRATAVIGGGVGPANAPRAARARGRSGRADAPAGLRGLRAPRRPARRRRRDRGGTLSERVLSLRELNRATLARQLLLQRERLPVGRAVERVAGLQAQWAPSLPVGLWTRLDGFEAADLERAFARKAVVRATLMRATIHLVSTRDYLHFHPALADAIRRKYKRPHEDTAELEANAARFAAAAQERVPVVGAPRARRAGVVVPHAPALPPRARRRGLRRGGCLARPAVRDRRRRASRGSSGATSPRGAPRPRPTPPPGPGCRSSELRDALERVGTRRFRDEQGRQLYDLPRAPLPDPDTPAPVRLLPRFDNTILSHADRTRVIADEHRKRVIRAGEVDPVVLVDGFVAARWRRKNARVVVEWLSDVTRTARSEVEDEARRLEAFLGR